MGNCLSDPSSDGRPKTSSAGGQRLGSTSTPKPTSAPPKSNIHTLSSSSSPAPQQNSLSGKNNYHGGRNTLGDGFEDPVRAQGEGGAREAALRAAEERQAKVSSVSLFRVRDVLEIGLREGLAPSCGLPRPYLRLLNRCWTSFEARPLGSFLHLLVRRPTPS